MNNSGMTVKILSEFCKEQLKKGNGDKVVLISGDDEGNYYHTLYFQFCDDKEQIKQAAQYGMFHDDNNPDDVVLLG